METNSKHAFVAYEYKNRRMTLSKKISDGIILFIGNHQLPINYPANTFQFRQDSSFLYFFGCKRPGCAAIIDCENQKEILFADEETIDDTIWSGHQQSISDQSIEFGIETVRPFKELYTFIEQCKKGGRHIHFLPPYQSEVKILLHELLGIPLQTLAAQASKKLIVAVVDLRSKKSEKEVQLIEQSIGISSTLYFAMYSQKRAGLQESDIVATLRTIATQKQANFTFNPIVTIHGEILHNISCTNMLQDGQLLLIDSGVELNEGYGSDITRTYPVSKNFTQMQAEVYEVVLHAQLHAISMIKPGVRYKDIHMSSCKVIAQGLKDLKLLKGDIEELVQHGAHALFFPHGLGHLLGLDAHDMESLGENSVGYSPSITRSSQFGLCWLRFARELEESMVITVEPGIYFIPPLIDLWQQENKFSQFINYSTIQQYRNFGGIRIEDDVVVTSQGARVLGPAIPKSIAEIQS